MTDPTFPDVVNLFVPGFIGLILIEFVWIMFKTREDRQAGRYETLDSLTSLTMGAISVGLGLVLGFITWGFLMALWWITPFNLGTSIWAIVACFILDDLRYYWVHRIGHRSRWVWASHVNHHSSQHYNLSTALRQSWTDTFTFMMIVRAPLVLIGFHPALVLFCGGINLVYQFWIHTEAIKKMPRWFEAVMNTPSHHRVHHGRNPRYLDANFAGVFIIWDKMFGTYVPEQEEDKPEYGLVHNLGTFNPLRVAFHEWVGLFRDVFRPGLTLRQRLMYAVAAPGWSHDGSRDDSFRIRAKYVARHPEAKGTPGLEPHRLGETAKPARRAPPASAPAE